MLDIQLIRENPEAVKDGVAKKGYDISLVDNVLELDSKWREVLQKVEGLRAEQKNVERARAQEIKQELKELEPQLRELEEERDKALFQIPNLPDEKAPIGKSEKDNVVLITWGEPRKFDFQPKDHLELGETLGIIDFETGSKIAGSGFYYLKNEGVLLELALVRYTLDFLKNRGYTLWLTPDLAREKFYLGTGYLPKGPEAQIYEIKESDLGLIATAEVTLAGIHSDEVLKEDVLPLRYAGYSHCFRQEAGSYGKYSKGLYRVHQFTKVEMFAYTKPEESNAMHEELLKNEEELWRGLGIPYRVIEMCTGDLGSQAARKFDLEAWMPGRNDWGEVTSTTNATDYQARNLNIRYRMKTGEVNFVHMINGTAIPTSRAIIAILENYQQKDGSVLVPEALRDYFNGIKEIKSIIRK